MKPHVAILKTDGINCDQETLYAFQKAGGLPEIVSINQLKNGSKKLCDFQILAIPGGFSHGDDIASGKVFALELITYFKEQLEEFVSKGNLVIGICNGFQVLVQMGFLPFKNLGTKQATLLHNNSAKFECRWVNMIIEKSACAFTQNLEGQEIILPVAHGEGKFFADDDTLKILKQNSIVLRYCHDSKATQEFPYNPNGSLHAIAGICDPSGKIFGLMPHPERYVEYYQNPNWRRNIKMKPHGLAFFEQAITYLK
ncbi:phosphoribosylformylglycinamidine synthase I [Candidatus Dependentiae bacterium]|nr:phosphoribosylformylglycinamidine synthase I [Candidatus Dependentiae bacterium]